MTKCFLTCFSLALFSSAFTQVVFQKTYGGPDYDSGSSVEQTTDGGYILLGSTSSFGNGWNDAYLIKTNQQGVELWHKTFGGTDWEFGNSVRQTSDGGYILCGGYGGLGDDSLNLIKTDGNGNEQWNNRYPGSIGREVGQCVQQTNDGGFVAVGFTGSGFDEDIYLLKTDANGTEQWNQIFNVNGRQLAQSIAQTPDNGFIIAGQTEENTNGGTDMMLMKTTSTGIPVWTKTFGGSMNEEAWSVTVTADGGYLVIGHEYFQGGNIYVVRTDAAGNEIWSNHYGGNGWDLGYDAELTSDGGFILTGRHDSPATGTHNMYLIKINSSGTVEWESEFPLGQMSAGYDVEQTSDGGFVIIGETLATGGTTNPDVLLIKTNPNGLASVTENSFDELEITAYPNPFTDKTTIEFNDPVNRQFDILVSSADGRIVRTIKNIYSGKITIHRNDLAPGIYTYTLQQNGASVKTGRLSIR